MDKHTKKWLTILSIAIVITVIITLIFLGFDLSGLKIHKGININIG